MNKIKKQKVNDQDCISAFSEAISTVRQNKGKNLQAKADRSNSTLPSEGPKKPAVRQMLFEAQNAKVTFKDHPLIKQLHDINYNSPEGVLDRMQQQKRLTGGMKLFTDLVN